jgi:hypothetical protein
MTGDDQDMTAELKRALLRRPFAPFTIVLSDGRRLEVVRKFQVALGLTRFTHADPKTHEFADFTLDQIVSLEEAGTVRTA